MTPILDSISNEAKRFIKPEEFDSLLFLFQEKQVPSSELIIFYKRNKNFFDSQKFWVSKLPLLHLSEILEGDLKVNFLNSYSSKDAFCNHTLNEELLKLNSSEFIRFSKFNYTFNTPAFWSSFQKLQYEFPQLQNIIKEFSIIRQNLDYLKNETDKENHLILGFSFIEVISAFAMTYEFVKQQSNVIGHKAFQTEIEMALVEETNRIIPLFQKYKKGSVAIPFNTNEELQNYIKSKTGTPVPDENLSVLLESIKKMVSLKGLEGKIDLYCCGYADILNIDKAPYKIKTNRAYSEFVFNNRKTQPEEFYLMDVTLETDLETAKLNRVSGENEIKHFNFYGIPTEIEVNGKKIDFAKVFKLVKHFSVYKGPRELSNEVPEKFKKLFGGNEIVSLFDYNQFVTDVSEYFQWEKQECEEIINFFATNPNEENANKIWINNPFIIEDNKILWLGTFLRDRRWENIFLNKIKKELPSSLSKQISKNLEIKVMELFKGAGFKAFGIPFFKSSSGKSGDIDVLGYFHGNIIIGEVKSGGRSDAFHKARYSEIIKHEGIAIEQLDKIQEYVMENWDKIKEEYNIDGNKSAKDLTFFPLIITDYFEGDLELYKNKYYKTSLLELDVIIKNNKEKLLKNYYMLQFYSNSNNPDFNPKKIKIDYDIWNGKKTLSIDFVFKKIASNAVWKEIGKIWKLEPTEDYLN